MHEKRIEIRWRDVDAYRHVNNAVYATYLEEGRDEWLEGTLGGVGSSGTTCSRASRSTSVASSGSRTRRSSSRAAWSGSATRASRSREQIRTRDGELAAESEAVIVARDRETGRSRPLSELERETFEHASRSEAAGLTSSIGSIV